MFELTNDDDGENRPWELPGGVRRDCEPHRAHLIKLIGLASGIAGALSLFVPLVLGVVGIGLGITARRMATRDLRLMRKGLMDPHGREATRWGKGYGTSGIAVSLTIAMIHVLVLLMPFIMIGLSWLLR